MAKSNLRQVLARIPLVIKIAIVVGSFWLAQLLLGYSLVTKLPSSNGQITSNALGYTWYVWDTYYYHEIATLGYQQKPFKSSRMENWAFFPLYPLAWKLFLPFANDLNLFILAGMGLSATFLVASLYLLYRLMNLLGFSDSQYWLSVLLLLSFPTSYVLVLPYTESLFLLLSVACLYTLFLKKYAFSACLAALALITRSTGVTLVPVVLLYTLLHEWRKKPFLSLMVFLASQTVVMATPILAFFTYLKFQTGNFWAAIKIQEAWFNGNSYPLKGIVTYFQEFGFHTIYWPHIFQVVLLIVLLISAPVVWHHWLRASGETRNKIDHMFVWLYSALHLLVMSSVASRNSLFRFALVIIPLFWWLPGYLHLNKRSIIALAAVMNVLHVLFLSFFVLKFAYYGY